MGNTTVRPEPKTLSVPEIKLLVDNNFPNPFSKNFEMPYYLDNVFSEYQVALGGHWEIPGGRIHSDVWFAMANMLCDPEPTNITARNYSKALEPLDINTIVVPNNTSVLFGVPLVMNFTNSNSRLVIVEMNQENGLFKAMRGPNTFEENEKILIFQNVLFDPTTMISIIQGIVENGANRKNIKGIALFITTRETIEAIEAATLDDLFPYSLVIIKNSHVRPVRYCQRCQSRSFFDKLIRRRPKSLLNASDYH
ncbi:MAG TPA: hypothetical protein VJJ80_02990 [Patescibacteria group bacterium]|nr:hypothetical protein [Patescibacteria group bacterium]